MKWYTKSYRRHLCDMHIGDWNPEFLSEFSPENYVENLKKAHMQSAMLYFQSHVGLCYYPTRTGVMHKAFEGKEDMMLRTEQLCHSNGIDVIGYYSITHNTLEAMRHPEWQMVFPEGDTEIDRGGRYGQCCPNNPDYRKFVREQIKEMLDYFKVEGMFYDMPFWHQVCHCKHCRERFEKEHGGKIPSKRGDPYWHEFMRLREKWMGEFAAMCTETTKAINPDITVEQNFASSVLKNNGHLSEAVNDACDYSGGDLYFGMWSQSFAQKYFAGITKNPPHEFMTSRCMPTLASHTTTKSFDKLSLSAFLTVAHHGANFFIDAIDPAGTLDDRVYELFGKVFEETEPYEPYMGSGKMLSEVGIYYQQEGKDNLQGQDFANYDGALNSYRTMLENHIPVDVFSKSTVSQIGKYKTVILSNPCFLTEAEREAFISYAENGGILYISGADEAELLERLLGIRCKKYTSCLKTYAAPKEKYEKLLCGFNAKYPLPLEYDAPCVEGADEASVLATLTLPYLSDDPLKFASIHSNPPGTPTEYPAIIMKRFGNGCIIWSAGPIEVQNIFHHKNIMLSLLGEAGAVFNSLKTDAPRDVELITHDDTAENNRMLISACRLSDEDTARLSEPFEIQLRVPKNPQSVLLLPENKKIDFIYENDTVIFKPEQLKIFDMYEIKF